MREICLDTETTGLDPREGHKIIEIGCVELVNKVRTGNFFHAYINPRREVPIEAFRVHGISTEFLQDKPVFSHIAYKFLDFIRGATLVIHNAAFDMKFLNFELQMIDIDPLKNDNVVDSLKIARNKFPGAPSSLDALCKRFGIDLSKRTKHGALLDAELLADIYIELMGGAQSGLAFENSDKSTIAEKNQENAKISQMIKKNIIAPRDFSLSSQELEAHQQFILKNFKSNLWGYSD